MSTKWATALGGAVSFVAAAVAGVLGNQLTGNPWWAWSAFAVVLLLGAIATGWAAYRAAPATVPANPAATMTVMAW